MKTNIGINEAGRKAVSDELAKLLADEFILYTKQETHIGISRVPTFTPFTYFLNCNISSLMR
ncbi:hypothetical protein [Mucilaginibacter gossypii]|uniref:Starvation-inducible DNA-binding protein n=1 Tax=Mucilaginibacter gossypii TaxID=551996 RepID=A0A1G8AB41_9SPHI|nr:hypothetical protein [Mucilaginibacter gossypii]SDH18073.1 starvation-inducible DNA-binding protein [Mucilaginibacter gossypii]